MSNGLRFQGSLVFMLLVSWFPKRYDHMPYLFFFFFDRAHTSAYHSDEIQACWWQFQNLLFLTRPVASHRSMLLVSPLTHTMVFTKPDYLGHFPSRSL